MLTKETSMGKMTNKLRAIGDAVAAIEERRGSIRFAAKLAPEHEPVEEIRRNSLA